MSIVGVIAVDETIQGMFKAGDFVEVDVDVNSYIGEGNYVFQLGESKFIAPIQSVPNKGLQILLANYGYENLTVRDDMDFKVVGKAIKGWVGKDIV